MDIFLIALAIFSIAIFKKPSAIEISSICDFFVCCATYFDNSVNFFLTTSTSSGAFPFGPKTLGKCSGWSFPSKTLQSVTVKGPPLP